MYFRQLAAAAAVLTFALMVLGSVVHATGSSLACPDWPLCNGTAFPQMTGGVFFEHSHRLVALAVAALALVLFVRSRRLRRASTRRLAALAVGLIAVQASLGALTVVLRLPPFVSIAHLTTSMCVLATFVLLAIDAAPHAPATASGGFDSPAWPMAAVAAAFGQVVLGAAVRHLGAALSCTDVPMCDGVLLPAAALARVHMVHRVIAVVAAAIVIRAALSVRARTAPGSALRWFSLVPCALVSAQLVLGVAVVLSFASLGYVTAHHATAALLWASLVALWRWTRFPRPVTSG